jgi:hypothetical protein
MYQVASKRLLSSLAVLATVPSMTVVVLIFDTTSPVSGCPVADIGFVSLLH